MSRLKHYTFSLGANGLLTAVATIYTLITFPLALRFVSKEEYGVWVNVLWIGQLLQYVDLEMSAAFARVYIDYRVKTERKMVDLYCRSSWLVALAQAVIVALAGWFGAKPVAWLLHIGMEYRDEFITLLRWYCCLMAISFLVRIFRQLLSANQRNDLVAYAEIGSLLFSLLAVWLGLNHGLGLWSFVLAATIALGVSAVAFVWQCRWLGMMPNWLSGRWFDRAMFLETWHYAQNRFWMSLGQRLVYSLPQLLITPLFGLGASTIWSAGTKALNLLQQLLWQVSNLAYAALVEMLARDEIERLRLRFRQLWQLCLSLGIIGGIFLLGGNSLFIEIWLNIAWPVEYNIPLVVWLLVVITVNTGGHGLLLFRELGFYRWIYYFELGVALTLIWCLSWCLPGMMAMPVGMTLATLLCSLPYVIRCIARRLQIEVATLVNQWLLAVLWRGLPWLTVMASVAMLIEKFTPAWWRWGLPGLVGLLAAGGICSELTLRELTGELWRKYFLRR